jgi:hypothetical protein
MPNKENFGDSSCVRIKKACNPLKSRKQGKEEVRGRMLN